MKLPHNVFLAVTIIFLSLSISTLAQQIAYTPEGKKVFLNEDGTYKVESAAVETEVEREEVLVVKKYLASLKWQDRMQYVRYPEKIKHLMADRYVNYQGPAEYKAIEYNGKHEDGVSQVKVTFPDDDITYYNLVNEKDGYKIDWKCAMNLNEVSFAEFKAELPTEPIQFMVYGKLGSSYSNYSEFKKEKYWCVNLIDTKGNHTMINGYISRESPEGQKLFNILKDGKSHDLLIKLKYLPNATSPYKAIITEIVNFYNWVEK